MKKRRHKHGMACAVTALGKLFCRRTREEIMPFSERQRACASEKVAEEMRDLKTGRWKSREQAIAVGLSRARKSCPAR